MSVGIYVLAAGKSMRFGTPKLDAPCAGRALGAWALAAIEAAELAPGTIIVPPSTPHFASEAQRHDWTLAINEDAERGLSSSLARAIRHAEDAAHDAACIFLADMPLITARHVRTIAASGQPDQPVATFYPGGRLGVPARLPRALFAALNSGAADVGAAALLAAQPTLRAMTEGADLHDVDSPADMARAEAVLMARLANRGARIDGAPIARAADG